VCTAVLTCGQLYFDRMTVCSCAKDDATKCRKPVQCSAETTAKDSAVKSTGNEFTDAEKLFAYMIEPITPPKFFK